MAQTYTAKGTTTGKAVSTLTINNVSANAGDIVIVGIAYDVVSEGNPTVKMGTKELNLGEGETISPWRVRQYRRRINRSVTRDIVATFSGNVNAAVMTVCVITEAGNEDVKSSNNNLSGTISTTGLNTVVGHRLTAHVHHHMTNGPSTDAAGSVVADDTLGQRAGTVGGLDTDNLTLNETYSINVADTIAAGSFTVDNTYEIKTLGTTDFTAIGAASNTVGVVFVATGVGTGTGDAYEYGNMRGRITGLATRDHAAAGVAYKPRQTFTIVDCDQYHREMNENPDWVVTKVEDESGIGFPVRIEPSEFDDMTDDEYKERIKEYCVNYLDREDDLLTEDVDDTRDTRMAGFVNDEIVI